MVQFSADFESLFFNIDMFILFIISPIVLDELVDFKCARQNCISNTIVI